VVRFRGCDASLDPALLAPVAREVREGRADPTLGRRRPRGRDVADPTLGRRRPQGRDVADPTLGRRRPQGRDVADPTLERRRPQGRGAWSALAPAPGIPPSYGCRTATPGCVCTISVRCAPPGARRCPASVAPAGAAAVRLQMAVRAADARPGRRRDGAPRRPGVRRPAGGGDLSGMSQAETDRIRPPFVWSLLPVCALLPRPRARLAAQALLAPLPGHLPRTGW
jgi:hypothetical protein